MLVIIGNNSAQHCFTRVVGIGSRSHDLFGVDDISLWTFIVVTGWKTASLGPVYLISVGGGIIHIYYIIDTSIDTLIHVSSQYSL